MGKNDPKGFEFQVDESSDVPLWVQLRNRIAYLISSGYYAPGEQLPTVRKLASDLSVNYNTVNKAYLALKSDGFIESAPGRGAFVRDLQTDIDEDLSRKLEPIIDDCIASCRALGLSYVDMHKVFTARIRQLNKDAGILDPDAPQAPGRIVTVHIGPSGAGRKAGA